MENVSWSRRDLHCQEEEKRNFLPRLSTLLTVQGMTFLAQLIRLDGKRRIGLERGWSMEDDEIGALSRPSLRQNSSAEKSLIEVQLIKQE